MEEGGKLVLLLKFFLSRILLLNLVPSFSVERRGRGERGGRQMSSVSGKTVTNFHTGSQILPPSLLSSQGKRREGEPATINPKLLSKQPPSPPLAPSPSALSPICLCSVHTGKIYLIFSNLKKKTCTNMRSFTRENSCKKGGLVIFPCCPPPSDLGIDHRVHTSPPPSPPNPSFDPLTQ